MKNRTLFKQEYIDAAMRASNFDNNKYKIFKMIYNIFGLLFGMGCIRYLIFQIMGSEEADWFMVIFYACAAAVFLYIGMIGMDRSSKESTIIYIQEWLELHLHMISTQNILL